MATQSLGAAEAVHMSELTMEGFLEEERQDPGDGDGVGGLWLTHTLQLCFF